MTALVARTAVGMEKLQWLSPAPLWDDAIVAAAASGLTQPWIAELETDTFVADFTALLAGDEGVSPSDLGKTAPKTTSDGTSGGPFKLFQPLSQRYYLVVATLVCKRAGIPDHTVRKTAGEKASFVMRRLTNSGEQAWVPGGPGAPGGKSGGSWQDATPDRLVVGERQLPMHPVPVAAFAEPDSTAGILGMALGQESARTVLYGYIPVSGREKLVPALTSAAAVAALATAQGSLPNPKEHPTVDELFQRVVFPWQNLTTAPPPVNPVWSANWPLYPSLYVLLDLADWLRSHLPTVAARIVSGTALPSGSAAEKLYDALEAITFQTSAGSSTVTGALRDLQAYLPLVTGADISGPSTTYDLSGAATPGDWFAPPKTSTGLGGLAYAALDEAQHTPKVPKELEGLIKADLPAAAGEPDPNETTYLIRTVIEHPPCEPVLSDATHSFVLARPFDPDAPARKIRIQLPDISNMRRFNRGVALEMSPSLRRVMDRVTPDMLKGDPLGDDPGIELGMICSFSLQIIFLVAFVVMFIFLLLLNIVFWWMAFLKICFPIPMPAKSSKPPAPGSSP